MRRASLLFVLCFCLGAAAHPTFGALPPGKNDPSLIAVQGQVQVRERPNGAAVQPVVRRMTLGAGYVIATGANGLADFLFPNGWNAKAANETTVQVSTPSPDHLLTTRGKVWLRVPHGRRTSIDAPAARAVLRGTEVVVEVAADGATSVSVAEGEVQFENAQGSVMVREGQQSRARVGEAPSAPVAANLPVLLEWTNALLPPLVLVSRRFGSEQAPVGAVREPPLRQADVLYDRGEFVEALAAYDRAPGTGHRAPVVEERRGQTLLELGRLEEAEAAFRQAVGAALRGRPSPETSIVRVTARAGVAQTLLARGDVEAARTEAQAAVAAAPERGKEAAWARLVLGVIEIRRRDLAAAGAALEQAAAADAEDGQVRAWRSVLLRSRGDLAGADTEARRAVALSPELASSHQALADVLLLEGRGSEARREAREAVARDSFSAGAHVSAANAALLVGRVEEALGEAHKGVALDPRSGAAHFTLGAAAAAQREYGTAERHLRQAVELEPSLLDARSLLGRVLVERGKRREAEEVARETLARSPELPSARAGLGQVLRLLGQLKEAAAEYERAVAAAPNNGLYRVELARVYLDLNDLAGALKQAQEGVFLLPGSSEAHAILGLVYDRQDNQEQAVREYREAISLSPENSLARLGLVTAFSPRARDVGGSGREQLRERAQALLRDPAVLRQVFEPGVSNEIAGGLGENSREEQRYLHRGEFLQGRLHDLTVASRFSDDGDRRNGSTNQRLLQTDIAVQATPRTQVLAQVASDKTSGGLPESEQRPHPDAYIANRRNTYNLALRQYLGKNTHLWLKSGIRSVRITRDDPNAVLQRLSPSLPPLGLYRVNQHANEQITELRLDHRAGPHLFSYGLAAARLNRRPFADLKYSPTPGTAGSTLVEAETHVFSRDLVQYLQDDYRLGQRGSLILGAQMLQTRDRIRQTLRIQPNFQQNTTVPPRSGHDLLPYLATTYNLDSRNLIRLTGNKSTLRNSNPLLVPSEAFIVGEPISVFFALNLEGTTGSGSAETYELDYERRFSARTFAKLFLQYSLAHSFLIAPSQEQQVTPNIFTVPKARAEIAGVRFEHQVTPTLSAFTRWSYWRLQDRTATAYGIGANPQQPRANPALGEQVPFAPRWRGLAGVNYVDRSGTKVRLTANFLGRRYTDVSLTQPAFGGPTFDPRRKRPAIGPHVLLDLRIAKEPSVAMEYSLTIINLFNTRFQDVWPGFPTRGRVWVLNLARRY